VLDEKQEGEEGSNKADSQETTAISFVQLDAECLGYLCWSDDPNDLCLETY
jgi:hypothetical protein